MIRVEAGGALEAESGGLLAVPVFQDLVWGPGAGWAAEQLGDWLDHYLAEHGFEGKLGQVLAVATAGRIPFHSLVLVGLGAEVDAEGLRQAGGWLGRAVGKATDVATTLWQVDLEEAPRAVVEGFLLGQYRFDKYRSDPQLVKTERLRLVGEGAEQALAAARTAQAVAEGVMLARDLINEPANEKSPQRLGEMAEELGRRHGLRVRVYDQDGISAEGFGGLAAVAAGAHNPPRMVELWYEPEEPRAFVAMVGKGIVFDSGGLSLKPPQAQETMKSDVSGAAAVFGAVQAIAVLGLPLKVLGVLPLAENMPGGGAMRPGDVIRPRSGKTVEVLNTDAEGRLVLADGLALAVESAPDLIVDLATLTGGCRVALGDKIAGLWSNDDGAAAQLEAAAARAGERVWRMPLPEDYRKELDSDVADLKNTGGRFGSSIKAALFLSEFVGGRPWVHLDIAGPARWPDEESYQSKGASGFGVRTLVALAEHLTSG